MNGRSTIKRVKRGQRQPVPEGREGCRIVGGHQNWRAGGRVGGRQRRVSFMNVFYCFRHNATGGQRRPDNSDGGTGKHKPTPARTKSGSHLKRFLRYDLPENYLRTTPADTSYPNAKQEALYSRRHDCSTNSLSSWKGTSRSKNVERGKYSLG